MTELDRRGEACTRQQLELAVSRFSEELKRQGKSLEDFCRERRIPLSALERAMRWQLTWDAYLAKSLTEESLQQYFERIAATLTARGSEWRRSCSRLPQMM